MESKRAVEIDGYQRPAGPYSAVIVSGELAFISGQVAINSSGAPVLGLRDHGLG